MGVRLEIAPTRAYVVTRPVSHSWGVTPSYATAARIKRVRNTRFNDLDRNKRYEAFAVI